MRYAVLVDAGYFYAALATRISGSSYRGAVRVNEERIITRLREADWNEVVALTPQVQVHVTPARHYSGRTFTRDQSLWVGFALVSPERRFFFSASSRRKTHGQRIDAMPGVSCRKPLAFKHVAKVTAAVGADNLNPATVCVGHAPHCPGQFRIKARPAAARFKFVF